MELQSTIGSGASEDVAASAAWQALTGGVAWFARTDATVLQLQGADRVDFLQRMTTADIKALHPGRAAVTVLTSPTARVVYVFTVLCRQDDLLLLAAPGQGAALERHLRGQIFFMDNVSVRSASGQFQRLRMIGPQSGRAAAALGVEVDLGDGAWAGAHGVIALADSLYEVPGIELLVPAGGAAVAGVTSLLAETGAVELTDLTLYEARRVELGLPAPGAELTDEVNPLEGGLGWACSENKGCYTGQEIIARQITYDKVTKSLVGLRSQTLLESGAILLAEGRDVGVVTSAALSPTLGVPVALAIVRRPFHTPGSRLQVRRVEGGVDAPAVEVVALPHVDG